MKKLCHLRDLMVSSPQAPLKTLIIIRVFPHRDRIPLLRRYKLVKTKPVLQMRKADEAGNLTTPREKHYFERWQGFN